LIAESMSTELRDTLAGFLSKMGDQLFIVLSGGM
jgi:hypothetical protein